jgi:hypothetical protein
MPCVRYILEQMFMCDIYVRSGSTRNVNRRFQCKFQDITVPYKETVHRIVNKLILGRNVLLDKETELTQLILKGMWSRYSAHFLRS